MPHIRIAADKDEVIALWDPPNWVVESYHHDLSAGSAGGANWKRGCGMRFTNVKVPQGSIIIDAKLTFKAWKGSNQDVVRSWLQGERNANPIQFSNEADYFARTRTTAKKDWSNIPHWSANKVYYSPSFPSIIQEIINLPGWKSGNPLVIFWHDHDDRSDHDFNTNRAAKSHYDDPGSAPLLSIYYIEDPSSEGYTIGGDAFFPLNKGKVTGQTFRPKETHTLEWIDLEMKLWLPLTTPWIHVYRADGSHEPFGPLLAQSLSFDVGPFWPGNIKRCRFKMSPYLLEKDEYYVMLARSDPSFGIPPLKWQFDQGDATYPRGIRIYRNLDTDPWTKQYNDDHIFVEFGTPPAPPPPPEPPIKHIAPMTYITTPTCTGYKFTLATNVPGHLWLYWTNIMPQKHKRPILRRGIAFSDALAYCFVAWNKVEQEEAGDTLLHTFIVEPWPSCELRWLTFRAKIDDLWSPSAFPIFDLHRRVIQEPFRGTLSNRTVTGTNVAWPPCHDALAGNILTNYDAPFYVIFAGVEHVATFWCHRGYLFFDTTLPDPTKIIGEAYLEIFVTSKLMTSSAANPFLYITQGVQNDPVITTNYGDQLPYTKIGGQISYDALVVGEFNKIPLNDTGIAWINKSGITKLCLRAELDVKDIVPPAGANLVYFQSAQKGSATAPRLVICREATEREIPPLF